MGVRVPGATLSRFWSMLAHYHGQVWISSEFARSFGVTDKTVRHYLDLLSAALVVRLLTPWHANVANIRAGAETFPLSTKVTAVAACRVLEDLR